jgi:hypothetical protein
MREILTVAVLAISLLATGTATAAAGTKTDGDRVDPSITNGKAARDLKQAREKWLDRDINRYRMTGHRSCFCAGPLKATITVRNRKAVKISDRPWYGPRTVPGAFRLVGQAIKRKVAVLDVKYDRRLGFPKKVWIDYIAMAVDDEFGFRITNFRNLSG